MRAFKILRAFYLALALAQSYWLNMERTNYKTGTKVSYFLVHRFLRDVAAKVDVFVVWREEEYCP